MRLRPHASFAHACACVTALAALAGCTSVPEGRSAVDSVRIVNARALDRDDVADELATTATPKFLGLFRGVVYEHSIFDASMLQRDLARVERYYRGHGFFEAHARTARVVHESDNHVRVEIVVDEGPPTLNREVRIDGLEGLPPEVADAVRVAATGALPRGGRFSEDAYRNAQTAIVRALTDRGYAYATAQADAQSDLGVHAVDYAFAVRPGPPCVYGDITIVDTQTDNARKFVQPMEEAPLRRAMHLRTGKPYSAAELDAATQALLDLEVLSSAQIVPVLADPPVPVVPLTVKIEPTKLRVLRLGGGVEFDEIKTELHALAGWEDHDFLGDLRDFSVDLKPGVVLYPTRVNNIVTPQNFLPEERLRLQLRQPGFLESRTTLFVRPELNTYPLLVVSNPDPQQPVVGYVEPKGSIGLDRRLGKHFFASLAHNVQGEFPFSYIASNPIREPLPNILLSFPQLTTVFDFRDDPVHPHAGFYASNDLQVAGVGGSATDFRVQPELRGYVPLSRGVTLAARGSMGFLFASNYGDYVRNHLGDASPPGSAADIDRDIEIVFFRGFFSGGPSTNRGFPLRGIAPHGLVPFLNPGAVASSVANGCVFGSASYDPTNCSVPIGGFTLWEASLEVRFDLTGPLGAAVFCDAGDVAAQQATLRPDHLHLSCGSGARYDTPVGPIRLDVGYRIQPLQVIGFPDEDAVFAKDPTEGRQPKFFNTVPIAVSFGIGEAF
ncbi:MAG TPA: BamA/TamA family outer membrane protein [Polyangiaceae bacterium]